MPSLERYIYLTQQELEELGHQVQWLMTGKNLAHGVCTRCSRTVVVEMAQGMRRILCDILDQSCDGVSRS